MPPIELIYRRSTPAEYRIVHKGPHHENEDEDPNEDVTGKIHREFSCEATHFSYSFPPSSKIAAANPSIFLSNSTTRRASFSIRRDSGAYSSVEDFRDFVQLSQWVLCGISSPQPAQTRMSLVLGSHIILPPSCNRSVRPHHSFFKMCDSESLFTALGSIFQNVTR